MKKCRQVTGKKDIHQHYTDFLVFDYHNFLSYIAYRQTDKQTNTTDLENITSFAKEEIRSGTKFPEIQLHWTGTDWFHFDATESVT